MLRRHVLIFHAAALGDFVLSWPLAMALGRLYPQSRIIYVTHGDKAALAGQLLGVEGSDVESGWSALFSDAGSLPVTCKKRLAGAQLIVSFAVEQNEKWAQNVKSIAGKAVEIISINPRPDESAGIHISQYILQQLHKSPVMQSAMKQMLLAIATIGVKNGYRGDDGVVLHPGSGTPRKCWPLDRFLQLAEKFKSDRLPVRIVLGEVERDRWPAGTIEKCRQIAPVILPASYLELLGELESASLFVGNDSGPGHLAAITGVPTLSLFGPTLPAVWQPLGPTAATLQADLTTLSVDIVYKMAVELLTAAKRKSSERTGGKNIKQRDED